VKFATIPVEEAIGAIAAHSVRAEGAVVKKGHVIGVEDAARLKQAGIGAVAAVRLDAEDVGEDEAAQRLAEAVAGDSVRVEPAFTGRSNLFSRTGGVLLVDKAGIDAINAKDETITVATLPAYKPVVEGEMIGTVKIIPYAVQRSALQEALAAAQASAKPALSVRPYALGRVSVVSTLLPGLKPSTVAKTLSALRDRLAPAGAEIVGASSVPHEAEALERELAEIAETETDLVIVFGASAIADRRDVIPAAIEAAGGRVEHFGMPVDPGNLLLIGEIGGKPVLGAPGCARSPKENGFDWVLQRLLAGIPVKRADIVALGVGGLLMEIVSRPQPRAGGKPEDP
jgi:molybdenum cofactor cytidylyltransferase